MPHIPITFEVASLVLGQSYIDGLEQDCSNSSALVKELVQPCAKLSIHSFCAREMTMKEVGNVPSFKPQQNTMKHKLYVYMNPPPPPPPPPPPLPTIINNSSISPCFQIYVASKFTSQCAWVEPGDHLGIHMLSSPGAVAYAFHPDKATALGVRYDGAGLLPEAELEFGALVFPFMFSVAAYIHTSE